ncbi:excalibur calcium-binding domain-containing protein [Spirillospora sp. NPDC048819]|uniref:excalibur calcium-binding domain-containing protein n=1 Tax=Spirillospora sp. NPDC048819 TaxID=3155268 RepID=UPI00340E65B8
MSASPPGRLARRIRPKWRFPSVLAALAAILLLGCLVSCGQEDEEFPQSTPSGSAAPSTPVPPNAPDGGRSPPAVPDEPGEEPATREPREGYGLDPRFDTCAEANAHGYGPYVKGVDPEYDWYHDADADGIDCEPRPGRQTGEPSPSPEPPSPEPSSPAPEPSDGETSVEPSAPVPSEEPPPAGPGEEPSEPQPGDEPSGPPGEEP